jgi:hypothetical protein
MLLMLFFGTGCGKTPYLNAMAVLAEAKKSLIIDELGLKDLSHDLVISVQS